MVSYPKRFWQTMLLYMNTTIIRKSNNLIGFFLLEDILINNLIRFHLTHKFKNYSGFFTSPNPNILYKYYFHDDNIMGKQKYIKAKNLNLSKAWFPR
jgi:hypothetical protein